MPVLHLENVPDELFRQLERLAASDNLPPGEKAVRLLAEAVAGKLRSPNAPSVSPTGTQREILNRILRNRATPPPGTPDSVELLREDRER